MERLTRSPSETKRLGESFARKVIRNEYKKECKKALVICLEGDLGGGKTTFVQGFARALGIKRRILSPTFVIMKRFRTSVLKKEKHFFQYLYHIDCYRLNSSKDIAGLNLSDIIYNPRNIVIIEWADKIRKILPLCNILIEFRFVDKKTRKIIIKGNV